MLVVISDLHLQFTAHDAIRYATTDGRVRESHTPRNVSAGALRLLLRDVCARSQRHASTTIELVLAGDIFEIHRTPLWFHLGDPSLRPWNDLGKDAAGNRLRAAVAASLDAVHAENAEFFAVLRTFVEKRRVKRRGGGYDTPQPGATIRVHFLPGNHDRLLNAWPSVRKRVRAILGIDPAHGKPFAWRLDRSRAQGYGVRVRHGHEYDPTNLGVPTEDGQALDLSVADYLKPCIGDWVTVEGPTRLTTGFRAYHAVALRSDSKEGERARGLYSALTEFDDVRPASRLFRFLASRGQTREKGVFKLLRPCLRDLYAEAQSAPFLRTEAKRLGFSKYLSAPYSAIIEAALKHMDADRLVSVIDGLVPNESDEGRSRPAEAARFEPVLANGKAHTIVAGHTHRPEVVPVPGKSGGKLGSFYIDSGTWRTSIPSGVQGVFGRVRAYTAVFCYHADERIQVEDDRRFETWTGHLAARDHVLHEVDRGDLLPPAARVVFTRVRVVSIDEGNKGFLRDGAEPELTFGLDHAQLRWRADGVQNGHDYALGTGFQADAYQQLDGEVWCFGIERDRGDSVIDMDDPLPWGIGRLPRRPAADGLGPFEPGPGKLALIDRSGNHLELHYEVRPIT